MAALVSPNDPARGIPTVLQTKRPKPLTDIERSTLHFGETIDGSAMPIDSHNFICVTEDSLVQVFGFEAVPQISDEFGIQEKSIVKDSFQARYPKLHQIHKKFEAEKAQEEATGSKLSGKQKMLGAVILALLVAAAILLSTQHHSIDETDGGAAAAGGAVTVKA